MTNFKYQRSYRSRNSGVRSCRSCRIRQQGLYPKIQDPHLLGIIFAKLPDSLAPELLQLLTPEFRNVLGGLFPVDLWLFLLGITPACPSGRIACRERFFARFVDFEFIRVDPGRIPDRLILFVRCFCAHPGNLERQDGLASTTLKRPSLPGALLPRQIFSSPPLS